MGLCGVSEWYRMTVDALKDCNKKHLAQLAKDRGISGWHAMRKDQLIRALSAPRASSRSKSGSRPNGAASRKKPSTARASAPSSNGNGHAAADVIVKPTAVSAVHK